MKKVGMENLTNKKLCKKSAAAIILLIMLFLTFCSCDILVDPSTADTNTGTPIISTTKTIVVTETITSSATLLKTTTPTLSVTETIAAVRTDTPLPTTFKTIAPTKTVQPTATKTLTQILKLVSMPSSVYQNEIVTCFVKGKPNTE